VAKRLDLNVGFVVVTLPLPSMTTAA